MNLSTSPRVLTLVVPPAEKRGFQLAQWLSPKPEVVRIHDDNALLTELQEPRPETPKVQEEARPRVGARRPAGR